MFYGYLGHQTCPKHKLGNCFGFWLDCFPEIKSILVKSPKLFKNSMVRKKAIRDYLHNKLEFSLDDVIIHELFEVLTQEEFVELFDIAPHKIQELYPEERKVGDNDDDVSNVNYDEDEYTEGATLKYLKRNYGLKSHLPRWIRNKWKVRMGD